MPGRFREIISASEHTLGGVTRTMLFGSEIQRSEHWVHTPQTYRRCWDATHPGPPYAEGGGLTIMKAGNPTTNFVQGNGYYIGLDYRPDIDLYVDYTGGFWPNGYGAYTVESAYMRDIGIAGPYGPNYGSGSGYGAQAYNRFKPKIATAELGQTIGEAAQFVPMLKQSAKEYHNIWKSFGGHSTEFGPKHAADSFLNHSFGWAPFVRDMVDSYDTYHNTDRAMRRLRKQNGRWEHRGGTVETTNEASPIVEYNDQAGLVLPNLPYYFYSTEARAEGIHVQSKANQGLSSKTWFEGRFRYYIPSLGVEDNHYNQIMNRIHTYGLRVSPSLVWKVTPWTWLADWFGNVGDFVSNAEDNYFGLASLYAYIMRTTTQRSVNDSTIRLKDGPVHCSWAQEIVTKTRHGASHFGFGLDEGEFSLQQQAILVALGISKGR